MYIATIGALWAQLISTRYLLRETLRPVYYYKNMKHWNENLCEKVIIGSRNNKQRDWNIMNSQKFIENFGVNYTHWQNLSAKHFSPTIPNHQMDNALRSFHLDLSNTN